MSERYSVPRAAVSKDTVLIADGGFTCIDAEAVVRVREGRFGLCVACRYGEHYLDGQGDGENYVGFKAYDHFKAH